MIAERIAIVNKKGGVGKTTTTVNLGSALAEMDKRVLLIDTDSQGAVAASFGIDIEEAPTLLDALRGRNIREVIIGSDYGVDLIAANQSLDRFHFELLDHRDGEIWLPKQLERVVEHYDYILFDCPPVFGLLTLSVFLSCNGCVIPVQTTFLSLRALPQYLKDLDRVRKMNSNLLITGILPTMKDRTSQSTQVVGALHDTFRHLVFNTSIRRTVQLADATIAGQPITSYHPSSPAAQDYRALAKEIDNGTEET